MTLIHAVLNESELGLWQHLNFKYDYAHAQVHVY